MKNKRSVLLVRLLGLAIIAAIVFSAALLFAGCESALSDSKNNSDNNGKDSDGSSEGSGTTFTTVDDFNKWLEKQETNTPDKPYRVKLTLKDGSFGGHNLRYFGNGGKYVYLDISDSTITSIGEGNFKSCGTLVGITIGNSFNSIGKEAFSSSGLTSVIIGNGVTNIGEKAFNQCHKLSSLTIGSSVTSIGEEAFYWCDGLTSLTIPDSVTSIGKNAFAHCSLTSLTIGNNVKNIGFGAFQQCKSLTSVTIPNSVTSIGADAFASCTNLTSVTFQGTITSFGGSWSTPFPGDLVSKYRAADGGIGTYTRPSGSSTWTKQPS